MGAPRKLRDVVRDETFAESAQLVDSDPKWFEELIRPIEWAISRNPESELFPEIPGTNLRIAKTDRFPDKPALRVFFSIEGSEKCVMHWVEILKLEDEEQDLS
jgi:hypothetical protein